MVFLTIIFLLISGCMEDNNDKQGNTQNNNPVIQSLVLIPENITYFNGNDIYYELNETDAIKYEDGNYSTISGDCMSLGRGIIFYNFYNKNDSDQIPNDDINFELMNVTLYINYKTCNYYRNTTCVQWTMDDNYINSTIQPGSTTEDITESALLFENNYSFEDLSQLKVKYFNPQGGIMEVPISFDCVWVEIFYIIS